MHRAPCSRASNRPHVLCTCCSTLAAAVRRLSSRAMASPCTCTAVRRHSPGHPLGSDDRGQARPPAPCRSALADTSDAGLRRARLQREPQQRLRELKVAVGGQLGAQIAQQAAQVGHLLRARHALQHLRVRAGCRTCEIRVRVRLCVLKSRISS